MQEMLVSLKDWPTDKLEGVLDVLCYSKDPYAEQAIKLVRAELKVRFGKFAKRRRGRVQ